MTVPHGFGTRGGSRSQRYVIDIPTSGEVGRRGFATRVLKLIALKIARATAGKATNLALELAGKGGERLLWKARKLETGLFRTEWKDGGLKLTAANLRTRAARNGRFFSSMGLSPTRRARSSSCLRSASSGSAPRRVASIANGDRRQRSARVVPRRRGVRAEGARQGGSSGRERARGDYRSLDDGTTGRAARAQYFRLVGQRSQQPGGPLFIRGGQDSRSPALAVLTCAVGISGHRRPSIPNMLGALPMF
jgi:hypothetical protein